MIHPLADVQSPYIGEGTVVWQFAIILAGARIGSDCNINCHTFIENDVRIGNGVTVKSGVFIWDGLTIGDNVFIGPNVTFTNDRTPRSKIRRPIISTVVKRGASIGANATVLPGVKIGAYAFVAAGAVVTGDVPPYTIWYGNPARHKGYVTTDGTILDMGLRDKKTETQYVLSQGRPVKITL